jgi:hypothetical protein
MRKVYLLIFMTVSVFLLVRCRVVKNPIEQSIYPTFIEAATVTTSTIIHPTSTASQQTDTTTFQSTGAPTTTAIPTLIIPSVTLTSTETPTVIHAPPEEHCLDIAQSLPKDGGVKGTLVQDTTLLDLETGRMTLIASRQNETISQARVSPNSQRLAFEQDIEISGVLQKNLVIKTKESVVLTIPWKDDWSFLIGWLDSNRLLFEHDREPYSSVIVFDPLNDQSTLQELILDAPHIFIYNAPVYKNGEWTSFIPLSFTYYNSSLTRVVFYQSDKEGYWTTIQDLQSGEILTRLPNDFNISTITLFTSLDVPVWTSTGKEFLVEAGKIDKSELYRVTQGGKITRLTYLTEIYKYARVRGYSLSFDERYIAFWYWAGPYDSYRMATLDTTTGKVVDSCISGANHDLFSVPVKPVWSHDSHQFVIEVPSGDWKYSKVIWVDVDKWIAAQITENMTPRGWMVDP